MLADLIPLLPQRELTREEIAAAAAALLDPMVAEDLKADFLRAWSERRETAVELAACAEAFLPQAVNPGVRGSWNGRALLDCCGTGGGGLNLVNISTALMFILAPLGVPVVKHGNRGLTKKSGSADVLEALGIKIDLAPDGVKRCLEEVGCAFLFAPAYHLSFAAVASTRRRLGAEGRRTIFNLLGPLLNPARPDARLVGVFQQEHVALYQRALEAMQCPQFVVAYGEDGLSGRPLGEASPDGMTLLRGTAWGGEDFTLRPGLSEASGTLETLLVADAPESARRIEALLRGEEQGLGREMVLINAALAAWTQGAVDSLENGLARSTETLDSGAAWRCLEKWRAFSSGAA